jgi:hypothetical protein
MFPPFLISIVGVLLIAGLLLWAIRKCPWIDDDAKSFIRVFIIVVLGVWLITILVSVLGGGSGPVWPYRR